MRNSKLRCLRPMRRFGAIAWCALAIGCPVEPRDFAKSVPGEDAGGDDPNGTGCTSATCSPASACLMDDPANCGACGHDCAGASCSNGKCQPLTVATTGSPPTSIAVSDSHVFWTANDGLRMCPKTGCTGAPAQLSADSGANGALVFDGSSQSLVFASCCTSYLDIYSASGARLSHTRVASPIGVLAADATYFYWTDENDVVRANRSDTPSPTIVTIAAAIPGPARALAVNPSARMVYAACTGNQGSIVRAPIDAQGDASPTNAWSTVAKVPNPSAIAIARGNLYFAAQGTSPSFEDGGVYQCPLDDCSKPTALITGRRGTAVIASASNTYFAINDSLYTCPLGGCGGAPALLAANSVNAPDGSSLTQDDKAVYWVRTSGSVMKLAK